MKAIVIYSGGCDSLTTLQHALAEGYECHALSFDYGQRHKIELDYARAMCKALFVPHEVVELDNLQKLMSASALTDPEAEMPTGHYQAEHMRQTVVPNRNMIMLSIAVAAAITYDCDAVFTGVHSGDHYIYPDCRPDFIDALNDAVTLGNEKQVKIMTPFIHADKGELMKRGVELGIDYTFAWTCYDPVHVGCDQYIACGKCGACVERMESVEASGATDNIRYATDYPQPEPDPERIGKGAE